MLLIVGMTAASSQAEVCFTDSFNVSNRNLSGYNNWAWSGLSGTSAPGGTNLEIAINGSRVRIRGSSSTTTREVGHSVTCGGGVVWFRVKVEKGGGTGISQLWSLYCDDASGVNLARWYGTATTARGRIGGSNELVTPTVQILTAAGTWDQLDVRIDFDADTSEFFFNNVSIGVLSHAGAGNSAGRVRFERQGVNPATTTTDTIFFDDLLVEAEDLIPPAPVTNFIVSPGNTQNNLFWTNSPSDYAGAMIRFRTDTYPTSITDGSLVVDKAGIAGQVNSHTHTGLTNGTTYFYSAFAHDSTPNYATAATASGTPVAPPPGAGPGVPNLTYSSGQVFKIISSIAPPLVPDFHGMAVMHNGWLVLQYSLGVNDGGHAFFDISNPFQPQLVKRTFHGSVREGHAMGFSYSYPGMYVCTQASYGIQFWDWTDIMNPVVLSTMVLPNIEPSDYDNGVWWVFWQAPYVYVGGSSKGLYVVNASDPANPVLVKHMTTSQIGGFRAGSLYAVGNLLVVTGNDMSGVSTLDISNPVNPVLLASNFNAAQYSSLVNGDKVLMATTGGAYGLGLVGFNISNPLQINYIRHENFSDRGGYVTFQDNHAFVGASGAGFKKIDISNPADYVTVGTGDFTESAADLDFASVMGNLTICSDDDNFGTRIMPHQTAPDTTPPAVNMINPKPNAVNQALTSRIGLTFTDRIDLRSVNSTSFSVRPMGGGVLPGKYSEQTGIVNFCPDAPLQANTTYEVSIPAGGIKDYVGNPVASTYTSYFTTGTQIVPYACYVAQNAPAPVNQSVTFNIQSCDDPGPFTYSWNFGDGSPATPFSSTSSASHTYSMPGHFLVVVAVAKGTMQSQFSAIQTIYNPPTPGAPAQSSTIALDAARQRVWNVNADANTVTCIDAAALTKLQESVVGVRPRNIAVAPDGTIWVTNEESATISVLNGDTGGLIATIPLAYASRPYGLAFSPTGNAAYVTLMGHGYLLKIDPVTRNVIGTLSVGLSPKGIAITHDGARILVSRFISPADHGEVVEVNAGSFAVTRTFQLALDPGPDSESSSRGVPNYVSAAAIAPDGQRAWVPSKKDNTGRGQFLDGQPLTFETTVRTIISKLNLTSNIEELAARRDLDNRSLAAAVRFTSIGDYAFVATLGSGTVDIVDAYNGQIASSISDVGIAPDGLVLSTNGERLFVHNFMSRQVAVYNVTEAGKTNVFPELARINTVQTELLTAQVLLGKQIFYNAGDRKMSRDKYLSCASCHFDGDSDGRVWDFTDRGEGLRNTISLTGKAGMRQGPPHWSANFDEIQDFENDIRSGFAGLGFMSNPDFNALTRSQPLGTPKAGVSASLDALAAYVSSLKRVPASPFRNPDGTMTADGLAGQKIFYSAATGCATCHRGPQSTDSELLGNPNFLMHDVGTITPASGQRMGGPLIGLDTPTLKGLWETWPYLHDGSAATLMDVITTKNPGNQHGQTSQLSAAEKQQLVSFLLQFDNVARADYETDGDVDQNDFGFLQRCLSGTPPSAGCAWADLNGDGLVNQSDYTLFQICQGAPELPADLSCAE